MKTLHQSPTDPAFVQNPYGFYDTARAGGDLFHWAEYGMACATSYKAVSAVLRDRRLGREVPGEHATPPAPHTTDFYGVEAHSMLELERPRHTRLRGLVLRAFTSRRIAALAPEIEALCHSLIDGFDPEFDLLTAYGQNVPVIVIARLLGVPDSLAPQLLAWSNAMVGMYQAGRTHAMEVAANAAARDFSAFLRGYVEQRRTTPADDLITHLIAAEEDGEKLSTDELITTCILLLNAGHEATVHTLGNGVKTILEHNVPREFLTPDTITATVEEIIRFDPPLHMFTRWVYEDCTVAGHSFKRGDQIACLLGAANRDPVAYDAPNTFDPTRNGPANTSFGAGPHFCVGAPLARLELQIALRVLFERHPGIALAQRPVFNDIYHFHGLRSLPVTLNR
ncbi:cytochrome P450 [Oceaniglobus ichthyenteri]|uniref:cytochrome P450 n=1 Tax=Oceaniglobus ichthyenteri TaxID=2136177 RepID=UPI000D3639B5|nr:cytochrome P450 [Oceaniglobus ichthyenteri]